MPQLIVPVRVQGDPDDPDDHDLELNLKISFRALLLVGVLLNIISVPAISLLEKFAW